MTVPAVRVIPKWTCRRERQTWEKNASRVQLQRLLCIKGDDQHPERSQPPPMSSTIYNVSPLFFVPSLPPVPFPHTPSLLPVATSTSHICLRASRRKISGPSEPYFLPPILNFPSIHLTSPPAISTGASSRRAPPLRGQASILMSG